MKAESGDIPAGGTRSISLLQRKDGTFTAARSKSKANVTVLDLPTSVTVAELLDVLAGLTVVAVPRISWTTIAHEPPGSLICGHPTIASAIGGDDPRVATMHDPVLAAHVAMMFALTEVAAKEELTAEELNAIIKWAERRKEAARRPS